MSPSPDTYDGHRVFHGLAWGGFLSLPFWVITLDYLYHSWVG